MEAYLEFALFSLLNISNLYWPEGLDGVTTSNIIAYTLVILCFAIPVLLFAAAYRSRWDLSGEGFSEKYGAFLDGTKTENPRYKISVIIIASVFFARRMVLCLTLVYWPEFLWGQIAL